MFKRLILSVVAVAAAVCANAQHAPGSWRTFPMSGEFYEQVMDTESMVFYITGGSLYSYDKEYNETTYYAPGVQLTGSDVKAMYYNSTEKYVFVAYSDANIDLIYEDGRIVNLPEIKNSSLTVSKAINHVAFATDRIYVATDFGLVVYDEKDHVVKESAMLSGGMSVVLASDEYIFTVKDYKFMCSPVNERHNSWEKFTSLTGISIEQILQVDAHNYLYVSGTGSSAGIYKLTENAPTSASIAKVVDTPSITSFYRYKDGFMAQCSAGMVVLDSNGNYVSTTAIPSQLTGDIMSSYDGLNKIWAANHYGLGCFDITGGGLTVLSERFRPESSLMFTACYCEPTPDGSGVYITSVGGTSFHPADPGGSNAAHPFLCERYNWESGTFTVMHPYGVANTSTTSRNVQVSTGSGYFYGGTGNTLVDPNDPTLLYHVSQFEGLVLIRDNQVVREIGDVNLSYVWGNCTQAATFDQFGNLWIGAWVSTSPVFSVLPKAKVDLLSTNPESITKTDFLKVTKWPSGETSKFDVKIIAVPGTDKLVYTAGYWGAPIIGYDTKGTSSLDDDTAIMYNYLLDQDGASSNPMTKTALTYDKNGWVWIGTTSGVFVVKDTDQLGTNSSNKLNVIRPKVARNDGTNYADYLLSSETILYIAVDPSNRKWIATQSSGLYLVNEDGTEILEHFTSSNSPLATDCIFTVACDPSGNDVLIGTDKGMYLYSSTSAPAAEDYSEVYAYPNPVRPDYSGWITINGLMDNSLVKIADMKGNVLYSTVSEGGMVVWDGCNADGSRVRSGVYLVLASQNASGDPSGVVTKIVVIN